MTTDTKLYLLKDRRPQSCFVDQIYDPDVDGLPYDEMARVIPAVGALAIDRNDNYALYAVVAVHPTTYKVTLEPARILKTSETEEIGIISYGNDKFMLYYDDRVKPTQLLIDGKLRLFGSALSEYRLKRVAADGSDEFISLYVESNDTYGGERIPLAAISQGSPIKLCTNCHTLSTLTDGETITLEVFDNIGSLCVSITLFVKRSTILNDLVNSTTVITDFTATANQMDGTDFYVHQRQPVSQLVISPVLTYSDGSTEEISVDNISCFAYGLDDFVPSFPGQRQKILVKKFLGRNQVSPIAETNGSGKFVSLEKWITVIANQSLDGIKVSIIPLWNPTTQKYDFKYVAYSDRRDKVHDVTNYVTLLSSFDSGIFSIFQKLSFAVDLTEVFGTSATVEYRQSTHLKLKHYNEFERYVLKDSADDAYAYGVEAPERRRPIIHFDPSLGQFFVPTSRFANSAAFVEAFYKMARPPYDPDVELGPVTPTHFTIRNSDNLASLIAAPIEIAQYAQAWNILAQGDPSAFVGNVMIVEFLAKVSDQYQIIYGVPVDVYTSPTGYNTNTNP